jgi:hypothetical protein
VSASRALLRTVITQIACQCQTSAIKFEHDFADLQRMQELMSTPIGGLVQHLACKCIWHQLCMHHDHGILSQMEHQGMPNGNRSG